MAPLAQSDQNSRLDRPQRPARWGRLALLIGAISFVLILAAAAGARFGLLLLIGLSLGATLEGLRFGFAGPWRAMILRRDPSGLFAQLLAIALVAAVAFPLLASHSGELIGAHAPIGFAMVGGAFVFGVAMQVVLGCGSGTLVNAASGNPVALVALPFFAIGSFLGAAHLNWWTSLGTFPLVALEGGAGLGLTLIGLGSVALIVWIFAEQGQRRLPRRLVMAAILVALLALGNLVVAGQPWGVVYGLGLWVAKGVSTAGVDLTLNPFWGSPAHAERIAQSLLTDVTSLTNLGLIGGAFIVAAWRAGLSQPIPRLPLIAWGATILAGLALGYSSRLAFGCNVGAFFSGISTGSLHGWVWFAAAFVGSIIGVRLRPLLQLEPRT
ncbi:YeeE/YedE family protein [Rhodobacterales bacterium FZCC0069]|nr:YeeE/YedE family protein [Rhodobacterales bacterium FZCC0069]